MANPLKIIVVEDNELEMTAIRKCADQEDDLDIVAATNSSAEAVQNVREFLPHAVILDLELHHGSGDGISFLRDLQNLDLPVRPFILVTTHNSSFVIHSRVRQLGADFILSKKQRDYSAELVIGFLKELCESIISDCIRCSGQAPAGTSRDAPAQASRKLKNRLNAEFDHIQIGHKLSGRRYLVESISLMIDKGCTENEAIKTVAENYRKTEIAVIQAMGNAIKKTWSSSDYEALLKYYTGPVRSDTGVPTVTEFIHYYIDRINYSE